MTSVTISQLKANPRKVINSSGEYPVAVKNRDKTEAYLVGSELFERLVSYIEDIEDINAVKKVNLKEATDFEEFVEELGL